MNIKDPMFVKSHMAEFSASGLSAEDFADNINLLFPINSKESLFLSATNLNVPELCKIYDSNELLYMFQRLLAASKTVFDDEKDHETLSNILKGGTYQVDKIYTKEEMIAEATRLAEIRTKELTDATVRDEESQAKIDEAVKLAADKKAEAEESAKKLAEAEAKLAAIEQQRATELSQRVAEKAEADAKELATNRVKELVEAGFEVSKSSEILFAYIKTISEADYTNLKVILAEVVESAKKMMTPEEKKKALEMMDEKEKNKKAKANLVDDSFVLPKEVKVEELSELDLAFASAFENKDGGQ